MNFTYAFLTIAVLLGLITSYEDFKQNKIKNKWIIIALVSGLLLNNLMFNYQHYMRALNTADLLTVITNFVMAVLAGYFLWHYNMWSAGDGKLFIAFSLLIPLQFYEVGRINYFPSFILLVNTFIPLGVILFLKSVNKKNITNSWQKVKKEFELKNLAEITISIMGLYWFVSKTFSFFEHPLFKYFLVIFIVLLAKKYFGKQYIYIGLTLLVFRVFFENVFSLDFIYQTSSMLVLFGITQIITIFITENKYIKEIPAYEITEGMVLASGLIIKGQTTKIIIKPKAEGIGSEELKAIQKSKGNIKIVETTHFALYFFIGVLLTILCKGNFLIKILSLIQQTLK